MIIFIGDGRVSLVSTGPPRIEKRFHQLLSPSACPIFWFAPQYLCQVYTSDYVAVQDWTLCSVSCITTPLFLSTECLCLDHIESLDAFVKLQTLKLCRNNISFVCNLEYCTNIWNLDLSHNQVFNSVQVNWIRAEFIGMFRGSFTGSNSPPLRWML